MTGISRAQADALIAELPQLRRFAIGLCANPAFADDLVQDCLERALKPGAGLAEVKSLGAWLRRIVHNMFVDEMRRRRVRGLGVDVQDLADDIALSVPPTSGEIPAMLAAAARLSLEHRHILVLAGVDGLSYREMAEELGLPIGTVMSRLGRARAALRAMLEPAGEPR